MAKDITFRIRTIVDGKEQIVQASTSLKELTGNFTKVGDGIKTMNGSLIKFNQISESFRNFSTGFSEMAGVIRQMTEAFSVQEEAEIKLTTIMRQRMQASDAEVASIKALASAQQELGVIGDEVQLAGAQQVATFLSQKSSIEALLPAMNNLAVQRKGLNVTAEDMVNIGNLVGKVMQGNVGALTRVGITFTEAEKKAVKFGTEEERAATLAQIITNNVGNMNEQLAKTDAGKAKQMANSFGDLQEEIGRSLAKLEPLLQGFSQIGFSITAVSSMTTGVINLTKALGLQNLALRAGTSFHKTYQQSLLAVLLTTRASGTAAKAAAVGLTAMQVAVKGLLISTGVGIAIAALTTVIEHFIGKSSDAEEAASGMGRSMGVAGEMAGRASQRFESTQSETYSRLMTKFKQLQAEWAKLTDNLSRTKWITANSSAFKDLGLKIDGVKDAENIFAGNTDTVVEAFKARAKAAAQMAQMEEEYRIQSEAQSRLEKANAQAQARHRVEAGQMSGTGEFHAGGHTTEGGFEEINSAGRWVYTAAGAARHNAQRYVANNAEARNIRRALAESQDRMRRIETELAKGTETPTAQANRGSQGNRSNQSNRANQTNPVKKGISYADQIKAEYEAAERERRIGEERLKDEAALDEALPVRLKAEWETKPEDALDDWDNLFKSTPLVDVNKEFDNVQRSMEAVAAKKAGWQKEMEDNGSMLESISSIGQSFSQLGQSIGGVGGNMISLLGQLATTAAETIGKLIALAAAEGSVSAFSLPWPASLAAWATVIAAITSATASIAGFAGMKFANGGLAYGPTVGMVGEYAGASQNPEVIAPLDKLRTLIEPRDTGVLSGRVVFRMKGRELEGVLERQRRFEGRT